MTRYYTRACNFYYGRISKILVNKKKTLPLNNNKEMVARISGSIDFSDEKFINWLSKVK